MFEVLYIAQINSHMKSRRSVLWLPLFYTETTQDLEKLSTLSYVIQTNGRPEMQTQDWKLPLWHQGSSPLYTERTAIVLQLKIDVHCMRSRGNWMNMPQLGTVDGIKWSQYTGHIHTQGNLHRLLWVYLHVFPKTSRTYERVDRMCVSTEQVNKLIAVCGDYLP